MKNKKDLYKCKEKNPQNDDYTILKTPNIALYKPVKDKDHGLDHVNEIMKNEKIEEKIIQ